MAEPRKKKRRSTGRPLENVSLQKLVKTVKWDIQEKLGNLDEVSGLGPQKKSNKSLRGK
jgi:hypothetical protein